MTSICGMLNLEHLNYDETDKNFTSVVLIFLLVCLFTKCLETWVFFSIESLKRTEIIIIQVG